MLFFYKIMLKISFIMKLLQNPDKQTILNEFEESLKKFEQSLGVNITIHDYTGVLYHLDGKRIFPKRNYHQCNYCMAGRFKEPGWRKLCVRDCLEYSDSQLIKVSQPYLKNCWKGVIELVIPLIHHKKMVAGIYVGAFKGEINKDIPIPEKYLSLYKDLPELPNSEELSQLQSMVTIFLHGMLATINNVTDNEQNLEHGRKILISRFIQQNASGNIKLADLAKFLCLSPSRTGHLIRTTFKRTFTELVLRERMILAKTMLDNDWISLEEIAERTGFKTVNYFNTVFKKNYGIPPGQYRKQIL